MSDSSHDQLLKQIQEDGKKFNPQPLLKRQFVQVHNITDNTNTEIEHETNSSTNDVVRIMQWNLLAQGLCQDKDGFILCPDAALEWKSRKYHVLEELLTYYPDILCLQEVDHFSFLEVHLKQIGYKGVFFPKPDSPCLYSKNNNGPDGCAMFWNENKVRLVNHENLVLRTSSTSTNQVAVICKFEIRSEESEKGHFFVVTTHLKSKVNYHKLRLVQGSFLENYLQTHCMGLPVLLSGDFNAEPSEAIIEVMKASELGFCSAYSLLSPTQEEPPYTTWKVRGTHKGQEEICHTIDYLFFTCNHFKCLQLLQLPTFEEMGEGLLPSYAYPSDHLSLVADLQITAKL